MSWVGAISIIVLIAAMLIGLIVHLRRTGKINNQTAAILGILVIIAGFITYLYPSALTATQEDTPETRQPGAR
jgi:NADH:ubiquinone oxidoreductase subunit 6 (subunit J)